MISKKEVALGYNYNIDQMVLNSTPWNTTLNLALTDNSLKVITLFMTHLVASMYTRLYAVRNLSCCKDRDENMKKKCLLKNCSYIDMLSANLPEVLKEQRDVHHFCSPVWTVIVSNVVEDCITTSGNTTTLASRWGERQEIWKYFVRVLCIQLLPIVQALLYIVISVHGIN